MEPRTKARAIQWHPRSWGISLRLTLWFSSAIALLLIGFAVLTYVNFHRSLHRDFDQHLTHELRVFLPDVERDQRGPAFPPEKELSAPAYQSNGIFGTFVRLLDLDGTVVYQSPNFEGEEVLDVQIPAEDASESVSRGWAAGPVRSLYFQLTSDNGLPYGWAEVTGYEWSLHTELDRLTKTFAVGILLAVLLSSFGGYLLAHRALSPVADITETAKRIRASNLSDRIPLHGGGEDELSDLTKTINGLLDRIEESFRRERRFSANAAHELATPLATMRAELELALRTLDGDQPLQRTLVASISDIDQISTIVRSLLMLHSAEQLSDGPKARVDFTAIVRDQLGRFQDRADLQQVSLEFGTPPLFWVLADRKGLSTVIDNLMDNALKYTEPGGSIQVSLARDGLDAQLTITDTGIGFAPEAGKHLFDRFYRERAAPVQNRDGSGLGLSIVAAVVASHEGRVWASSPGPGQGSTFGIALPLASA
jgi:signal transduction histidine kinase